MTASLPSRRSGGLRFADLFTPKLIVTLREGYTLANLRADVLAGLTVAIVAAPLSMAIAIASGASPTQGLYTAIIGGFIVSALGGSRFQIGGPAGAFIVLVAATVQTHGIDGMILATILAGIILTTLGFLQLGSYIKFIPYPVTIGFTAGIAVIIFASQLKELLGLTVVGPEPGPLLEKLPVLWTALRTLNPTTVAFSLVTILIISGLKKARPRWPGMLIAVTIAAAVIAFFDLPIATIGTQFGGISSSLPTPSIPEISLAKIQAVLPNALAFSLLGAIESLLSAVVADGMTGRRHRSNCELVGQGIANIASGLFGGLCVTGTIARTATNVRAGAHGPIAGMFHAGFLLLFVLVAAPLTRFIPLASLSGVLAVVAWNMVEKQAFVTLLRTTRGDATVLMATFLLTVFRDLTEAIIVGFGLGAVLFIHRMSKTTAIETDRTFVAEDQVEGPESARTPYDASAVTGRYIVYRISGVFFFGAAASIGSVLERISDTHQALIIDFAAVPFLDSTAANMIEGLAHKSSRRGVKVVLTSATHTVLESLFAQGVKPPLVSYQPTIDIALRTLRRHSTQEGTTP